MNQRSTRGLQLGVCLLFLTCAACQQEDGQQVGAIKTGELSRAVANKVESQTSSEVLTIDQQVQNAVADLTLQAGVQADRVMIKEVAVVQWPSGAMGCPQPGMNYTQALVPGVRVVLALYGEINLYHGAVGKALFFCPKDRAQTPAQGTAAM
jgi:hypothetical protein